MMIRRMTSADLRAVEGLLAASPEAAQWVMHDLAQPAWPRMSVWVAEEEAEVIGFVAVRTAADEAEILNLAVAPAQRRRGAGKILVETAIEGARAAGCRQIYLEVRESNAAARAFYACLGFADFGRRPRYYNGPIEDALVLLRSLD